MKISQKLIIILLLIALIPLSIIGFFAYTSIQNALDQQIKTQIANTLSRQTNKIDSLIKNDLRRIDLLVVNAQIRFLIASYNKDKSEKTQQDLINLLTDMQLDDRNFRRIHILNPEGVVVGSNDKRFLGRDYSNTQIFKRALRGPDISMFLKDIDGILGHYLVERITLEGQLVGVAITEAQADSYTLLTKDYADTGKTGETFLIGHSDKNQLIYLTPLRFNPDAALTPYVPSKTNPPLDYQNHPVLLVTKEIPNTNWIVGVKIDETEIYAPVVRLRDLTLVVITITTAIVFFLALYLARFFTAPIIALTDKTRLIMQGDLAQRINIFSSDEIGTLAITFNAMTARLQELYQGLEQKVRDRTQTLNEKVQELEDAKAKDDAILSSVGDGMIVTGSSGTILLMNSIAAGLLGFGFNSKQLVGQSISICKFHDDNSNELAFQHTPSQVALQTGHKVVREVKLIRKDGSSNSLSINAMPIFQAGKITGVIQLLRDITREKEVDRMKTEFISLASHQLKTPLSAIRWFTEMLLSGDAGQLNKQQTDFAVNVSDSTQRMVELVNSLLNISRIESGRIIIDPRPTNVSELVQGVVNDLKAKIDEKKQIFIVSVHRDLPIISLDPHLIGQVYLNLLTNAIKYTPEGGEIAVFVSRKGDELVSQISDNGLGIPIAQQRRVFQKFFRADNIAKVVTDGTGLGLYLVKAIIESSGGRITFQSQERKGTTFWFSLPMTGMIAKKGEVTLT